MADKKYTNCTIAVELWDAWKKMLRTGDKEEMAKTLGYSHPVIGRALKYGYVNMPELPGAITKFFQDRIDKEKEAAAKLMQQN